MRSIRDNRNANTLWFECSQLLETLSRQDIRDRESDS